MSDANDIALLREFAGQNSEKAFAELVRRHINLVYSVAMRFTGNTGDAQDVTQVVFIILARKAAGLSSRTVLTGWLYETTRFTARRLLRSQARRRVHELEASMQSILDNADADDLWRQLAPHLEAAMSRLGERDRTLLALRYYENKTGAEAAALLGIREEAARKRINRALERLRRFFVARGVTSTTTAIAGAISANSVQVAPTALVKTVTAAAIAKGAAAPISTITLIKGALKIMAWTKAKTAIAAGVGLLLVAGTTTVAVKEIREHRPYPWQVENANTALLNRVPPQVKIVPTIFPPRDGGFNMSNNKMIGMGQPINNLLGGAYAIGRYRIVFLTQRPEGHYDFIANLPQGNQEALRREIARQFHLIGKKEMWETDVLVLSVKSRNAPGLRHNFSRSSNTHNDYGAGYWRGSNLTSQNIAGRLERYFKMPVIDRTGLAGRFDVDLKWDEQVEGQNPDAFKEVLLDQLGLELTPDHQPVEMLVVERAKN